MSGASLPPSSGSTPPPAQPPGRRPLPLPDVQIQSLPPKLAFLAHSVTVTGQVVAQGDGAATIRTPAGDVVVKTPTPLPTDRPVQFQIPADRSQTRGTPQPGADAAPRPAAPQAATPGTAQPAPVSPPPGAQRPVDGQAPRSPQAPGAAPVPTPAPNDGASAQSAAPLPTLRPNVPVQATVLPLPVATQPPPGAPAPPQAAAPQATAPQPAPPKGQAPQLPLPEAVARPLPPGPAPTQTTPSPPAPSQAQAPPPSPATGAASLPPPAPASTAGAASAGQLLPPTPDQGRQAGQQAPVGQAVPQAAAQAADDLVRVPRAAGLPGPEVQSAPKGTASAAQDRPPRLLDPKIAAQAAAQGTDGPPTAKPSAGAGSQQPGPAPGASPAPADPTATMRLAPGQSFQVRLIAPGAATAPPSGSPTPPGSALPPPGAQSPVAEGLRPDGQPRTVLQGTVAGATASGQLIVGTPAGTLVLNARSALPPGTPVQLAVDMAKPIAGTGGKLDVLHGRDWPALKEVMTLLAATDPALARQIANASLPQANKRLATNLVLLLNAMRGGDAGAWLGDSTLSLLDGAGRGDLRARLAEDMRAIARQAAEPLPDGWTLFPIPFGDGGEIGRMQFYVRKAIDEDEETDDARAGGRKRGETRRFVIDLDFSRLGAMQMDGLVWPGHLDLILRTRTLLPQDLRDEIGTIFRGSLEAVGFAGTLGFQTGAHAWVTIKRGGAAARA